MHNRCEVKGIDLPLADSDVILSDRKVKLMFSEFFTNAALAPNIFIQHSPSTLWYVALFHMVVELYQILASG